MVRCDAVARLGTAALRTSFVEIGGALGEQAFRHPQIAATRDRRVSQSNTPGYVFDEGVTL